VYKNTVSYDNMDSIIHDILIAKNVDEKTKLSLALDFEIACLANKPHSIFDYANLQPTRAN